MKKISTLKATDMTNPLDNVSNAYCNNLTLISQAIHHLYKEDQKKE